MRRKNQIEKLSHSKFHCSNLLHANRIVDLEYLFVCGNNLRSIQVLCKSIRIGYASHEMSVIFRAFTTSLFLCCWIMYLVLGFYVRIRVVYGLRLFTTSNSTNRNRILEKGSRRTETAPTHECMNEWK